VPLPRYCVVVGTPERFTRDPPDDFGHWYHGHLRVGTPDGAYESALDVDTPSGVGVSFRVSHRLDPAVLGPVASLDDGQHLLGSSPESGALDYGRTGFLQDAGDAGEIRLWQPSTGDNALSVLETAVAGATRVFLFGDGYATGRGVHDVHQNQGDPEGSQWYASDGIWQDGGVGLLHDDGLFVWQVRFNSQRLPTDDAGHSV
jgi:hypothetical protein